MKIEDIEKAVKLKDRLKIVSSRLEFLENFESDKDQNRLTISARGYGPKPEKKFLEFYLDKDENIDIIIVSYFVSKYRKMKDEIEKEIESL
jgi:hypothetical protein